MSLESMDWAVGLRGSLQVEIDAILAGGLTKIEDLQRVVQLRQHLRRADALIKALDDVSTDAG